jgi:hypothetical protein
MQTSTWASASNLDIDLEVGTPYVAHLASKELSCSFTTQIDLSYFPYRVNRLSQPKTRLRVLVPLLLCR